MTEERLTVVTDGRIRNDKSLDQLVRRASDTLLEIIGPFGSPVTAAWSLKEYSPDRQAVVLELSDLKGNVQIKFAPDELKDPRGRLHRAWGALL